MDDLVKLDQRYLWHPFTQQAEWEHGLYDNPIVITRGRGVYLFDSKGRKYIDGVSSLWANLHGHRNPYLVASIRGQLNKVAHSTFLGLTHEPGIRLAKELLQCAPKNLSRVFYSDNGSTAVEAALKMAVQYHAQSSKLKTQNYSKTQFLALKNSYHGDTIGSVSVGGIDLFHKKFRPLIFKNQFAMSPHCLRCPYNRQRAKSKEQRVQSYVYKGEKPKPGQVRKETGCKWECLGEVEAILKKNSRKIAAAIIEPVVQGAGGILTMPPGYLWGFSRLCRKYGIFLIADEVAVGFGRTGKMFACEHEAVQPDFLCLAKGISGGYLPLAATLTTEKIYRAFLGKYEEFKTFFHGHTYTANPLACAAGRANLEVFRREKTLKKVKKLIGIFRNSLKQIADFSVIGQIRQAGLIAGIEVVKDRETLEPFPVPERIGKKICFEARKQGLLLRPLGDVLVLMPPLSITAKELFSMLERFKRVLRNFEKEIGS